MERRRWLLVMLAGSIWLYGVAVGHYQLFPFAQLQRLRAAVAWHPTWDSRFAEVAILSTVDGSNQKAMFLAATEPRPLVVSLHSWSGTYAQLDALADSIASLGWNYIRPDVRGANDTPAACLSPLVTSDLDDAIQYAIEHGAVDQRSIFVVGGSGGAYTAMGSYLRTRQPVNTFFAWNGISDLQAWRNQSQVMGSGHHQAVDKCAPTDVEARARSPLHMPVRATRARIELFAGLHDGHSGPVPVSHSIEFFNKVAKDAAVSEQDAMRLLSRNVEPTGHVIDGRAVYGAWNEPGASLVVYEGGHDVLVPHTVQRMQQLAAGAP